jgi:hypothetical protein
VVLVDVSQRKFGTNGVFWCEVSPKNIGAATPPKTSFFFEKIANKAVSVSFAANLAKFST